MPGSKKERSRIKVLHILGTPEIGGIEKLVFDLSITQKTSDDVDPGIFFTLSSHAADFRSAFEGSGVVIHYGNFSGGLDISGRKIIKAFRILKQYQLLHFHVFNPVIAFIAVTAGKTILYTDHGAHGQGRIVRAKDRIKLRLERFFLNRYVSCVTFNSKYTEVTSRKRFGLKNVPGKLVYNGISGSDADTNKGSFDEGITSLLKGKYVVGTCSRLAGFKRVDRLIEGFEKFQAGKNAVLLIVGDGPDRGRLEKMVKDSDLAGTVIFSGFRTNVTDYQNAMDVCVFPSEGEPFGLVAVETLLLGKPVIVFGDGGGITEIIEGINKDDIVIDIDELVLRLDYYHVKRVLPEAEKNRRKKYAENYNVAAMADNYRKLYISVAP